MEKTRKRLDKIVRSSCMAMQEDVSSLLGKSVEFSEPETQLISKEEFFSDLFGKMVCAAVRIEGDRKGSGCLIVSLEAAIRIGGTLIMLPELELDSAVNDQQYSTELQDSYGEIANLICGAFSTTFEEQHPQKIRLIRKEQQILVPVEVEAASDEPCPDGEYYHIRTSMELGTVQLGELHFILPTAPLGLVEEEQEKAASPSEETGEESPPATAEPKLAEETGARREEAPEANTAAGIGVKAETRPATRISVEDAAKRKKKLDKLARACLDKVGTEVGALLGGDLEFSDHRIELLDKEALLDQLEGKQIMARMDVRGLGQGEAFLFTHIRDAVFLGGTLIMLPDAELEEVVGGEEFGHDVEDAYGEISNIIAGVYTSIFEEQYNKSIGFVKKSLEVLVPVAVDPDSDQSFPDRLYYVSAALSKLEGRDLGQMYFAVPASFFELDVLVNPPEEVQRETPAPATAEGKGAPAVSAGGRKNEAEETASPGSAAASDMSGRQSIDILVIGDDDQEAGKIASLLTGQGFNPGRVHFKDALYEYLPGEVRCIFLVMKTVSEQGFGVAIKVSSMAGDIPLIIAGPAWTRSLVLKAVRYGADDILITPASDEDVKEKVDAYLNKIAA